jgi:hypothetical protein
LRLEQLEDRTLLSTVNWINATGGDWDTASNWDAARVPTATDDAVINVAGITVTHSSSVSDSVHSLSCHNDFSLSAGTLVVGSTVEVTGTFKLSGGTLSGATVTSDTTITGTTSGGTLDAVTLQGTLDLRGNAGANAHVRGGLTLDGTALLGNVPGTTYGYLAFDDTETLGGSGSVVLGSSPNNALYAAYAGNATLTIGPGVTVRGAGGGVLDNFTGAVVNQGSVRADNSVGCR